MSKGPGTIEKRIAELFAATRDRALSVGEIADHAFELAGQPATRAQRLSATRAGHRVVRRVRDARTRSGESFAEAHRATEAALGRKRRPGSPNRDTGKYETDEEYTAALKATPAWRRGSRLWEEAKQLGNWLAGTIDLGAGYLRGEFESWRATTAKDRTLYFHPPDVPVRVWAVDIQPAGVIWADAEVVRITHKHVMVRYAGETARLDRDKLWRWWALWRNVYFASSRTGRAAKRFDEIWWDRYGQHIKFELPPNMRMPLAEAIALLGVPANFTREDIIAAFRRKAKKAHPDVGGTAEQFRNLVIARDRLLASIGSSAPAPKAPSFAPKGAHLVYRRVRLGSSQRRLGPGSRRLARA
jgi:hypothetical protein